MGHQFMRILNTSFITHITLFCLNCENDILKVMGSLTPCFAALRQLVQTSPDNDRDLSPLASLRYAGGSR